MDKDIINYKYRLLTENGVLLGGVYEERIALSPPPQTKETQETKKVKPKN